MMVAAIAPIAEGASRERFSLDRGWKLRTEAVGAGGMGQAIKQWRWKVAQGPNDPLPMPDGSWADAKPGEDVFRGRVGFAWFSTVLPKSPGSGHSAYFTQVDDNATVYLNGEKVAHHAGWNESFDVSLDAYWNRTGENVLTVLVENTEGPGGISETLLQTSDATPAAEGFDDSTWRAVDVPHDFVIEQPFDPSMTDIGHGFHPGGIAWYRRHIEVPASANGKRIWLEFDGVYRNSRVWLNGKLLGAHPSGYTSFYYDATDAMKFGGDNVLTVRADTLGNEGWWYEGGGIYRHVWMSVVDSVHVAHWGTFVTSEVKDHSATITARATIESIGTDADVSVSSAIVDADGKEVGRSEISDLKLQKGKSKTVDPKIEIAEPHLWSVELPYLYTLVTTVKSGGAVVDTYETKFGVRTIHFDIDKGFFLNGQPVKLKGTCNHQDFAGVGVALPDRLHVFKIEKLKEMGANAYRCSHHPPAGELLDACDRLGMLVMDENRHLSDSPESLEDVRSMVMRDRNHPSIVLWSLCNEEAIQASPEGKRRAAVLKEIINRFDGTRLTTAAMHFGWGEGLSDVIDVLGFNYSSQQYEPYHKSHPKQLLIATETASILTTRGVYTTDPVCGHVTSYTDGAEGAWRPVAEHEYIAGGFVWTGFDYRGEPTPFGWPDVNSNFGAMDTCGFPKDDYFYYQAWWGSKPVIHLMPHWNWAYPNQPETGGGADVDVRCYSNCERVELFLNGKSLGAKPMPRNSHVQWKVQWHPGVLSAKGFDGDKEVATTSAETVGLPAAIKLSADREAIHPDGADVTVVSVSVVDDKGRNVPMADDEVTFEIGKNGKIIGVGNGDPASHEADKGNVRRAFNGRCAVVVQSDGHAGLIELTARAHGLRSGAIQIKTAD